LKREGRKKRDDAWGESHRTGKNREHGGSSGLVKQTVGGQDLRKRGVGFQKKRRRREEEKVKTGLFLGKIFKKG